MALGWGNKMAPKQQIDDEDMSMEEILASIRKYVTNDHVGAKSEQVPPQAAPTAAAVEKNGPENQSLPPITTSHESVSATENTHPAASNDTVVSLSSDTSDQDNTGEVIQPAAAIATTAATSLSHHDAENLQDDDDDEILDLIDPVVLNQPHHPDFTHSDTAHDEHIRELEAMPGFLNLQPTAHLSSLAEMSPTATTPQTEPTEASPIHVASAQPVVHVVSNTDQHQMSEALNAAKHSHVTEETHGTLSSNHENETVTATINHVVDHKTVNTTPVLVSKESVNTMTNPAQATAISIAPSTTAQNDHGLASTETVSASASALSRLMQAVKPQATTQSQSGPSHQTTGSAPTLDTLITDLARPMVKTWIDQNLTHIIESMVAKEIEKITKDLMK